ncbi:hypothetical protein D3C81_1607700 [compost metagenome]
MLLRHVGFGAMGGDADGLHADAVRHAQVFDGADAGQQQRGHARVLQFAQHRAQVFLVAVRGKAVVDRGAAQAIAVGHFDQRHAGGVQAAGDALHLLQRDLVALRVHAVAQGHVVQGDALAHGVAPQAVVVAGMEGAADSIAAAMHSAVRAAEAVMMSRLPAYLGR